MGLRVWYTNVDRSAINWPTAVVSGRADVDILRIWQDDTAAGAPLVTTLWAAAGSPVTTVQVTAAQAEASTEPIAGEPSPFFPLQRLGTGSTGGGGGVSSVNGRVGPVVLGPADVNADPVGAAAAAVAAHMADQAAHPQYLTIEDGDARYSQHAGGGGALVPATAETLGGIKLAGALGGTANAPTVPGLDALAPRSYVDSSARRRQDLGDVSGTVIIDLAQGAVVTMRAVGPVTLDLSGWQSGVVDQAVSVHVRQDAAGGRTVTWPATYALDAAAGAAATTADTITVFQARTADNGFTVLVSAMGPFATADRYDTAVLALPGLIYYLPLEEASGTVAADASGNGRTGTYAGAFQLGSVAAVPSSAKRSPAFSASGTTAVIVDAQRPLSASGPVSIGFVLKVPNPGITNSQVIYGEGVSASSAAITVESAPFTVTGGTAALAVAVRDATGNVVTANSLEGAYFDGASHTVILSRAADGVTWTAYRDGALDTTIVLDAYTAPATDRAAWGALRRASTSQHVVGVLGRVWVRDRVTTQAEASALSAAFGTSGGGTNPGGGDTGFDANGVKLNTPTAGATFLEWSAVVETNRSVTFSRLEIRVTPPEGTGGTPAVVGASPGVTVNNTTRTLSGTMSTNYDWDGVWTIQVVYALVQSPAASDFVFGPTKTIGLGGTGNTGNGGGGGSTELPSDGSLLAGISGPAAADGTLAAWWGKPPPMGGTWNDALDGHLNMWTIRPGGGEWGEWTKPLDLAIGGVFVEEGQSWAGAATGALDSQWTQCLNQIKTQWGSRNIANLYIRFCHEFNLGENPYRCTGANASSFVTAWRRFHGMFKQILPAAKLVWCPNAGTSGSLNLDVRNCWPGKDYVDVGAIDFYNSYPHVNNQTDFNSKINQTGSYGEPIGCEKWRQQFQTWGVPMGIGEWANNGDINDNDPGEGGGGDDPQYLDYFRTWMMSNKGNGPGQMVYAVYFNLWDQYAIYPTTMQPNVRDRWKAIF